MPELSPDLLMFFGAMLGLGTLVAAGEGLRTLGVSATTTRRLVHVAVALFVSGTPWLFSGPVPVYLLAGIFVLVNAISSVRGWWPGMHAARPESWGTVALPLAVLPALAATWSVADERVPLFQVAFLVLALADPLAAWVGERHGRRPILETVTPEGTVVFGLTAFGLVWASLFGAGWKMWDAFSAALLASVVAATVEAISGKGWDNFFVVLAVILVLLPLREHDARIINSVAMLAVGALVTFGAKRADVLTTRGAAGAGLFAMSLVGLGGWTWAVPGFVFFVLSSALSFLPEIRGQSKRAPQRSLKQVLANGGLAWTCLAVYVIAPVEALGLRVTCYVGFLGALSAAAADTWATEIGIRWTEAPWSLRTFSRVPSGTSGAISFAGTIGAALGAASVAGAALLGGGVQGYGNVDLFSIVGAGVIGMLADGLAGAVIQARYRAPSKQAFLDEPPTQEASPVQGWKPVSNDVVNFIGTLFGATVSVLLSLP